MGVQLLGRVQRAVATLTIVALVSCLLVIFGLKSSAALFPNSYRGSSPGPSQASRRPWASACGAQGSSAARQPTLAAEYPPYASGSAHHRLWDHDTLLQRRGVQRGLYAAGDPARLRRAVHRLLSGQPLRAQAMGGSITKGAGGNGADYIKRYYDWVREAFPGVEHRLRNAALGGTWSGVFTICAGHVVAPDDDLVVVEFAVNDGDFPYNSRQLNEILIRKLLSLPGRPAVLIVNAYAWMMAVNWKRGELWSPFYGLSGNTWQMLAAYYGLPVVSTRSAAYPLMQRNASGYVPYVENPGDADFFYADGAHPQGITGHRFMAEMLRGLLVETARGLAQRPYSPADEAAIAAELPPPAYENNFQRTTSTCLMEKDVEGAITGRAGFEYGDDGAGKWGWIATAPGAWLELRLDTRDGGATAAEPADAPQNAIALGMLMSYEKMGRAKLECVRNCRCDGASKDFIWNDKFSQTDVWAVRVSQHEACEVRLTVLDDTSSGEHKVKLAQVMLVEGGGNAAFNYHALNWMSGIQA